jgi:hypothetical protein
MTDPAAQAARSAAVILAPDLGPSLPAQVEAALAARNAQQRSNRFLDPVALGGLIVAIATLAWTVYNDLRNRATESKNDHTPELEPDRKPELKPGPTPGPTPEVIARQVRITMREQDIILPTGTERITEIVAAEIIRHAAASE